MDLINKETILKILKEVIDEVLTDNVDLDEHSELFEIIADDGTLIHDFFVPIDVVEYHLFSSKLETMKVVLNKLRDINDVVYSNALEKEIDELSIAIKGGFDSVNEKQNNEGIGF